MNENVKFSTFPTFTPQKRFLENYYSKNGHLKKKVYEIRNEAGVISYFTDVRKYIQLYEYIYFFGFKSSDPSLK